MKARAASVTKSMPLTTLEDVYKRQLQIEQAVGNAVRLLDLDVMLDKILLKQTEAGNINGHDQFPAAPVQVAPQPAAHLLEHIAIQLDDKAVPLKQGDELLSLIHIWQRAGG